MPPKVRFGKERVLDAALQVTREGGIDAVNARSVAKKLGCSTQPLFSVFGSMDELKNGVTDVALSIYEEHILEITKDSAAPYLGIGRAYIDFARVEPELFRLLFMSGRVKPELNGTWDKSLEYATGALMEKTGCTREQAAALHRHMWIYAHGLAVLLVTHCLELGEAETDKLLETEFKAIQQCGAEL